MIRLSKKIEYAILAVQYISRNPSRLISAKEISEKLNISFEFLSKTLQKLIQGGIVSSRQGAKGGYSLAKPATEVSVEDIIKAIDENTAIVECFEHAGGESCGRTDECTLRSPIGKIQHEINTILRKTTIADLSRSGLPEAGLSFIDENENNNKLIGKVD